jgi:predicted phosphodiesterase
VTILNFLYKIHRNKNKDNSVSNSFTIQNITTPIKGSRILIISDIHYLLTAEEEKVFAEDFDQCWILGDINKQIVNTLMYSAKYPIYAVLGNHDTQKSFSLNENSIIPEKVTIKNIDSELINEKNFTLTGMGGSSRYKEDKNFCMVTQEQSLDIFKDMKKADVLISHDSAFNIHSKEKNKEGLRGITEYINKYQPKLHIYGHHHQLKSYKIKDTLCICNFRIGIIERDGTYHNILSMP